MPPETVYQLLEESARTWPDRTALVDGAGEMTFTELLTEAESLRSILQSAGVGPGIGLGLMARNGCGFIIGLFAAAGTGATVMPMSHQLRPEEAAGECRQAGLHAVYSDGHGPKIPGTEPVAIPAAGSSGTLTWTGRDPEETMVRHVTAHFVRFTSGTTGASKGVLLSNRCVLERTAAAQEGLRLTPDDAVVWVLQMAYHFVVSILMYVRYGVKIIICENLLAQNILSAANRHGGTILYAAPMQIRLLAAEKSGTRFTSLRTAISTSSSLPPESAGAFEERYGIPVRAGYGIIEAGLPILNQRTSPEEARALGDPLPSFEIGILDRDGHPCPAGHTGRLALRGPGLFDGYLNPPVHRNDVLRQGWFFTGDLARRDETGLIWLEGREKNMINVSGNKVFPEEVEAILDRAPGVERSRAFGVPHPMFGEVVQAEVCMRPGHDLSVPELRKRCVAELSPYKIPQRIEQTDHIPLTSTGKIRRDKNPGFPLD